MKKCCLLLLILMIYSISANANESEFFKQLKDNYSQIEIDLLKSYGRVAQVKNFVYKKDIATFTFEEGTIHLLRYIENRPTTAIFIGKGTATIVIPSEMEKLSLSSIANDSMINENFENCFIRMADDFDKLLEENFQFEDEELGWRTYNVAKESQGEYFFRPSIKHKYDNNFQLLKSVYERNNDGYFWIDFNRFNFSFDPDRAEEVRLAYEIEGGDVVATDGVVLQKKESAIYDNSDLSNISYNIEPIDINATLEMTGLDGMAIDPGECTVRLAINDDSLRFITMFLHFNIKTDSVFYKGIPVDYHHRRDFGCINIILPEYKFKGDTIALTLWYKGKTFDCALPAFENPKPFMNTITLNVPKDYNYIGPDMVEGTQLDKGRKQITIKTQRPYRKYIFQGYASGYDTLSQTSDMGLTLNFLKSKHLHKRMDCYIPDDKFEGTILRAFNFYAGRFGAPFGTFVEYIYPEGYLLSMPGLIKAPQIACITDGSLEDVGGFHILAGNTVARQWYGSLAQHASNREAWLYEAVPEYLSLLFMQADLDGSQFYSNLVNKRDSVYRIVDRNWDVPLATGFRASETVPFATIRQNKGAWLIHMLRFLMFDTETQSDRIFIKFLHELIVRSNSKTFSNADVVQIAEKRYGDKLDWFFSQWLYGTNYPEYDIEYSMIQKDGKYFVEVQCNTQKVPDEFKMPVIIRVEEENNSSFIKQMIPAGKSTFELGPFETNPKKFHFNEFFSVLSKDNVKKK